LLNYCQNPHEKQFIHNHRCFYKFHADKISSIACCDDDSCGLVENPRWCTSAYSFSDRCEVQFSADHWKKQRCWSTVWIHCISHHSFSASFPRVVHSFSLRRSCDDLLRTASKGKSRIYIFLMLITIFPTDRGAHAWS